MPLLREDIAGRQINSQPRDLDAADRADAVSQFP